MFREKFFNSMRHNNSYCYINNLGNGSFRKNNWQEKNCHRKDIILATGSIGTLIYFLLSVFFLLMHDLIILILIYAKSRLQESSQQILLYIWCCKSENFCENFIFENSVKRHICDLKYLRLGHDLPISFNDSVISPFCKYFIFTKLKSSRKFPKETIILDISCELSSRSSRWST